VNRCVRRVGRAALRLPHDLPADLTVRVGFGVHLHVSPVALHLREQRGHVAPLEERTAGNGRSPSTPLTVPVELTGMKRCRTTSASWVALAGAWIWAALTRTMFCTLTTKVRRVPSQVRVALPVPGELILRPTMLAAARVEVQLMGGN
jgi:hypothetical protein